MCTLPAKLDCGSLTGVSLSKIGPDNDWFRYWQTYNSFIWLTPSLKKRAHLFQGCPILLLGSFYDFQLHSPTGSFVDDFEVVKTFSCYSFPYNTSIHCNQECSVQTGIHIAGEQFYFY